MSRTKSAANGNPPDSSESDSQPRLLPLTPDYKKSEHALYVNHIERALTDKNKAVRNIALSGSYGVGKSSILQEVVKRHEKKVVEVSFSTTGLFDLVESDDGAPRVADSKTNRIQREIVKQILYREDPARMPGSRYRRIGRFKFWRQLALAALAAGAITLVFYLAGLTERLVSLAKLSPYLRIAVHLVVFLPTTGFGWALGKLFHNRIRIEKLSAGPATISLSVESPSFFDEYLDEIVYFFDVTGRDIVVFEDLDRFNDPHIFETLRALNTLLNRAGQLKERNIRFIYAMKDSIFDALERRAAREEGDMGGDAVEAELERVNRTKFFDLVIPVVPFITHKSAGALMGGEMEEFGVSRDVMDLAARHLVDMRLIRNVRNEFVIFQQKILRSDGSELKLKEDALFAMMLYKNTHLLDFEEIKVGKSKIDELYKNGRRLVAENRARLTQEAQQVRQKLSNLDSIAARSASLGAALKQYIERLERHLQVSEHRAMVHGGQAVTDEDLGTVEFWQKFVSTDKPLEVTVQISGRNNKLSISRQDTADALGDALSPEQWQESEPQKLEERLRQIQNDREFLVHADMAELMGRDKFELTVDGEKLSLSELAARHLKSELARQLVAGGYIDRNFTLYTSTYSDYRVSPRAMNFLIHNVEDDDMDVYFWLTPDDVDMVLRERGESALYGRGMYNINVLDHLLESMDAGVDPLVQSLMAFGEDERSFLGSYLADGKQQEALVRKFAQHWQHTFIFVVSDAEVDESARIKLVNAALDAMVEGLEFDVDDAVREYFEGHYLELDVFRLDATSKELAVQLTRLLVAMDARLSSLDGIAINVRGAVVAESRYPITRANLVAALGGREDLALDEIRSRDRTVYEYVLGRLSEYLTALRETDPVAHTIESPEAFQEVLEDVLEHSESLLPEVLTDASPSCRVADLADVSEAAWPALADNRRFPATFENVTAYIETVDPIDEHLAGLLEETGSIEVADGVEETDKVALAERLLAAREVLPEPDLRTRLVADLRLEEYLPVASIQPESGQLIGLLIENDIVEDTPETFALGLSANWETREFVISKSKHFASFMTPTEVPTGDVAPLMRSGAVSDEAKSAVVDRFSEFTQAADRPTLTAVAEYAVQKGRTMPVSDLVRLAGAGVDAGIVLPLLERLLPSISLPDLVSILEGLGGEYADVSARNGKRPKLPNMESCLALVRRLEQFEVASSHRESGGKIRVNMKKRP